jgi:hypothetical protein
LRRQADYFANHAFITGSDFLMDGGVTVAYWYGELAPQVTEGQRF